MFNALTKKYKEKRGFTLMEVLVVVAIIAVIAVISVTGILRIRENLSFRQKNDYAKTIFMAAQSHLTELRATSGLEQLQSISDQDAHMNELDDPDTAKHEYEDYCFTYNDHAAYNIVLPVGSVETIIREQNVIIEYNPKTGNVYSVYYSENDSALVLHYREGHLPRNDEGDEEKRRDMMLGYYDGSDLSGEELGLMEMEASIEFDNGEEGMITVIIPTQDKDDPSFTIADDGNYGPYMNGLTVKLTIVGEMGGSVEVILTSDASCPYVHERSVEIGTGGANFIHITFPIDSLVDGGSFADLVSKTNSETNTTHYMIQPGDNVSVTAEVTYASSATDPIVEIEEAMVAGVNPMFHSLTAGSSDGKYILTLSNGRNLQNLNLLSPSIAEKVESVIFVPGDDETENIIDWNDTVEYYNEKYGSTDTDGDADVFTNAAAEAPGRALPYFVPIMNDALLGTPAADDTIKINGNGVKIYDLNIDNSARDEAIYANTGLFATANTTIDGINIVNPVIRGSASGTPATGALVGLMGSNASISNCGVYIDTEDIDFVRSNLNMKDFTGYTTENGQSKVNAQYGVSGSGAVGGLIGYAMSAEVDSSFAAVPVYGSEAPETTGTVANGYGGLVGLSSGTHFNKCYASGTVSAQTTTTSYGAGGFVGTSSNSNYANCFATGDVNASAGNAGCAGFVGVLASHSTVEHCYSTGLTSLKEAFCGYFDQSASIDPKKNYYFNQFESSNSDTNNTISSKLAVAITYEQLTDLLTDTNDTNLNYEYDPVSADHWGLTSVQNNPQYYILNTHPYDISLGNSAYPFTMLKADSTGKLMDYYGNWPRNPLGVGIAYYEIYKTNDDEYFGFYFDREKSSTLKDNEDVLFDGYMILSETSNSAFGTLGIDIPIEGKNRIENITIENNPYYVYPVVSGTSSNSSEFYTELKITITEAGNNNIYTFYYNPNVALSHINPADGSTTAIDPGRAPSTIYIRTARQLAAVGENMASFWDENYIQQLDIDFNKYQGGTALVEAPIGNGTTDGFTGSYIGRKDDGSVPKIIGYAPADGTSDNKISSGIFGVIGESGVVRNLNIETGSSAISGGGDNTTSIGLLAGKNQGTVEKVNVTVNSDVTLNASATAGLLVGENSGKLINCQVSQAAGTATLNAAHAGGLVGSVSKGSELEKVSVTLNKLSGNGNLSGNGILAGVFGKIGPDVTISDIPFLFTGTDAKITSSGSAAGFVGETAGTITDCSVRGKGTIEGTTSAAGFAVKVSGGTVDGCVVSPALNNEDYKNKNNSNLSISGASAAGFVVTNNAVTTENKNDCIRSCTALGTVTGNSSNVAGFVVTNTGTIEYCMSNVDMTAGTVFAKTNSGTVKECYGWASDDATLDSNSDNTVHYTGSYFGVRNSDKNIVLFDFNGTASNYPTATLSQASAVNKLTGGSGRSVWVSGGSYAAYPYSTQPKDYPYPMIREHYGNWPTPSNAFESGILYYEKYDDGDGNTSWGVHLINMTDIAEDSLTVADKNSLLTTSESIVKEAGYALFCKIGTTPFCNETNAMMGSVMMPTNTYSGLYSAAGLAPQTGTEYVYGLYPLNFSVPEKPTDAGDWYEPEIEITVENLNRTVSIDLIPLFADTLNNTREPFSIRTQAHLENIKHLPDGEFVIDRCFSVGERYLPIDNLTGELVGLSGAKITATGMNSGLINKATGAIIDGVNLDAKISVKPVVGTDLVLGTLVNTARDCEITNCMIITDIAVYSPDDTSTQTADTETNAQAEDSRETVKKNLIIGGIVGRMEGGILEGTPLTDTQLIPSVSGSIQTNNSDTSKLKDQFNVIIGGAVGVAASNGSDRYGVYTNVSSSVTIAFAWDQGNNEHKIGEFVGYVYGGEFTNCSGGDTVTARPFLGGIMEVVDDTVSPTHYSATAEGPYTVYTGGTPRVVRFNATLINCTCDNGRQEIVDEVYYFNSNNSTTYTSADSPVKAVPKTASITTETLRNASTTNNGLTDYYILVDDVFYQVTVTVDAADTNKFILHYTNENTETTAEWTADTVLYTLSVTLDNSKHYVILTERNEFLLYLNNGTTLIDAKAVNANTICTVESDQLVGTDKTAVSIKAAQNYTDGNTMNVYHNNSMVNLSQDDNAYTRFCIYEVTVSYGDPIAISYKCVFTPTT